MKGKTYLSMQIALVLAGGHVLNANAAENEEQVEQIERINVTGSRILREGAISPSPITVISGEDLLQTGVSSIGEALNDLPALTSSQSFSTNHTAGIGSTGLSLLNLRSMGVARTLVLVDGRRHVAGQGGSAAVDVNTIPTSWIERVEIISGGASAVYGADAVTGVVNFILKKNVTGLDVSATLGASELSKFKNDRYSLSYGQDFDEGRGNIALAMEYSSQNTLNALDHPWTSQSNYAIRNVTNDPNLPDTIVTPNAGLHFLTNSGIFWLNDGTQSSFNDNGSYRQVYLGDNNDGSVCSDCDFINLQEFVEIQPKFSRYNLNFKTNYDFTKSHNVYFEAKRSEVEAQQLFQGSFNFGTAIGRDNPFLHPTVAARMDATNTPVIFINKMNADLGRRQEDNTRTTDRYVIGVEGDINEDWYFDTSLVYGKTKTERIHSNNLVLSNFFNAVWAIDDGNGNIVCGDATARSEGCQPLDIMGNGAPSEAARDYVNTTSVASGEIKQTVFSAIVKNDSLFELDAGSVGFAGGFEYRKEQNEQSEPSNILGTVATALGEDNGEFDVNEVFAEVSVPVLSDTALIQDLTLDAAIRYADYSTIGNATSWKLGIDLAINDELRFRATQSEAIRAPNISELFGEAGQAFFTINDPCRASNLSNFDNNAVRAANCAALNVPADFDSNYDQASIEGVQSGNADLEPEESTSTTVGLVYQPNFLEGFVATVDYWQINLDDAIASVPVQDIIDRCVDSPAGIDNVFCPLVPRDPNSHEITTIFDRVVNLASLETAGVDVELGYDFEALGGQFTTSLIAQHFIDYTQRPIQAEPEQFFQFAGVSGTPEWSGLINIQYSQDKLYAAWSTRFIDKVSDFTEQELADNPNPSNILGFGRYFISNASVGYRFDNGLNLRVGVDNIFNREPDFIANVANGYDNLGRFAHLTVSYSM